MAGEISSNIRKRGLVEPKYLQKFAFDIMISESLGIPESVADFIEGRTSIEKCFPIIIMGVTNIILNYRRKFHDNYRERNC